MKTNHDWWPGILDGPLCLTKVLWGEIRDNLDPKTRVMFDALIRQLDDEAKFIDERHKAMTAEFDRMQVVGDAMRRAGITEYQDKDGRKWRAK